MSREPPQPLDPRAVFDALPTPVMIVDARERVLQVNEPAAALLGERREACVGQPLGRLVKLPRPIREAAAGPESAHACMEVSLARTLGAHVPTSIAVGAVRGPAGEPAAYACVLRADLGTAPGSADGLQHLERLIAMGQMVTGFAHEVRNPLAALKSLVEDVVAQCAPDDPRAEDLARIDRLIRRIESLVRSSLQFGRPGTPHVQAHDPAALVCSALEMVAPRVRAAGATTIPTTCEKALPTVYVDDNQIVQVLVALLSNALDASDSPDAVSVRVRRAGEEAGAEPSQTVLIEVENSGPGIPPEILPRIFDPFFTTKARGTGLGLAIAHRLARENGGQILVRSQPGARTTFTVELPTQKA